METHEGIGQLGKLIRQTDGSPIVVEYSDSQIEVDRTTGQRGPSRESFTPRFNRLLNKGTLVEIPGAGLFKVSEPLPGQEMPDSIYAERISRNKFKADHESGIPVVMPDNLDQMR